MRWCARAPCIHPSHLSGAGTGWLLQSVRADPTVAHEARAVRSDAVGGATLAPCARRWRSAGGGQGGGVRPMRRSRPRRVGRCVLAPGRARARVQRQDQRAGAGQAQPRGQRPAGYRMREAGCGPRSRNVEPGVSTLGLAAAAARRWQPPPPCLLACLPACMRACTHCGSASAQRRSADARPAPLLSAAAHISAMQSAASRCNRSGA